MAFEDFAMKTIDFLFERLPFSKPSSNEIKNAKIIAHRGDHINHIENTLAAFKSCVDAEIFGIELDIRWTKDLVPIIAHNTDAGEIYSRPDIVFSKTNFDDLRKQLPMIPTFSEVIDSFKDKIHLFIELKSPHAGFLQITKMQSALEEQINRLSPGVNCHFISLNIKNFQLIPQVSKKHCALIAEWNANALAQSAIKENFGFVLGHYLILTKKIRKQIKEHNIKVATGYINHKNTAYREIRRGSPWLFSNNPIQLKNTLKKQP